MDDGPPPTPLYLPTHVPLPVSIGRLRVQPGQQVRKTQPLFSYSYSVERNGVKEREVELYDSPVEGELVKWSVKEGDLIRTSSEQILHVREPCTHDVQLHGMCALCGKDLTETDYTGFSHTSRADISMVHDVGGLTVSLGEASRLEKDTSNRLRKSRKLSLIVDLDQTIIHATVDPTVGEWLNDSKNPNFSALEGTQKFQLGETPDVSKEDGCWYYVKMRPGLRKFLKDVADIYEMHVYTMGTRAYASEVCKIIDPDGGLFGGRILSRDESGSMTRKSLQRLFPCDTSMVVIIDDRADVWDGSPNLVKVVPYEFFVGIGDINAAFLPKKKELTGASGPPPVPTEGNAAVDAKPLDTSVLVDGREPDIAVGEEKAESPIAPSLSEASASTAATIHDQIENRPLSKTQAAADASASSVGSSTDDDSEYEEQAVPVLRDEDEELERLYGVLKQIRDTFYSDLDKGKPADVKDIVPTMKQRVLVGTNIVFSGVVALGTRPEDSEYWKTATLYGAQCSPNIDGKTTHVVANQDGTSKVISARRNPRIQVVWTKWLLDSIALWSRQPESMYLVEDSFSDAIASTSVLPPIQTLETESAPASPAYEPNDAIEDEDGADLAMSADDWAAANDELDAFLNETDDEGNASDATDDSSTSEVSRKRPRRSTDSDDEGLRQNGTSASDGSKAEEYDSPLQKRVKTSRNRKSKLKVSFPPGTGTSAGGDEDGTDSIPPSQTGSVADSDDEAFLAMLAAAVEDGFEKG